MGPQGASTGAVNFEYLATEIILHDIFYLILYFYKFLKKWNQTNLLLLELLDYESEVLLDQLN